MAWRRDKTAAQTSWKHLYISSIYIYHHQSPAKAYDMHLSREACCVLLARVKGLLWPACLPVSKAQKTDCLFPSLQQQEHAAILLAACIRPSVCISPYHYAPGTTGAAGCI
jgi:hypothetical protein